MSLTRNPVAKQDKVSSEARALVEARDNAHCFMLDQKPDPSVSVRFDHAWVIPPSFFDDSDMDPQVCVHETLPLKMKKNIVLIILVDWAIIRALFIPFSKPS